MNIAKLKQELQQVNIEIAKLTRKLIALQAKRVELETKMRVYADNR